LISLGIIAGFLFHHMVCAVEGGGVWYHSGFWGGVVMQSIIFFFPTDKEDDIKLHIHHYYWPLSLLQLCVFSSSEVSLITAAMLCAISMHGIAFFGVQPLMYHKESNNKEKCNNDKDNIASVVRIMTDIQHSSQDKMK